MVPNYPATSQSSAGVHQRGVALLQVLLIGAVISILAIRFTVTARDQVEIAEAFENRLKAQMKAHSVLNEAIFVQLSEQTTALNANESEPMRRLPNRDQINLHAAPIEWGKNVEVTIQDLNGLLPQLFPEHYLWSSLLLRSALEPAEVERLVGTWTDVQDPDRRSWLFGDAEPDALPNGQRYLNAYAQSDVVLSWLFDDHPRLLAQLKKASHLDAPFNTNLLNSPNELLERLLDPQTSGEIIAARDSGQPPTLVSRLLPDEYRTDNIFVHDSSLRLINIIVKIGESTWQQTTLVDLTERSMPVF